jgi:DNA repair exonuclease SbcCD ATPase subunit
MIVLRALEVERFRRHDRPTSIEFDERFTVIRGQNEAGKSTMLQALQYAFFRRSSATGHDIERLSPWGTSGVRPTVNVEFAHDGTEFRLEKSWGGGGSTRLFKRGGAGGAFAAYRTDGADDFVNALFCGEPHGKGTFPGFRAAHRGLGHLLFATQGALTIADDDRESLNPATQSHLSRLIGTGTKSTAEIALTHAIAKMYADVFKKDGRGLTVRAESPKLEKTLAELDLQLATVAADLSAYERVARERRDKAAERASVAMASTGADEAVNREAPRLQAALEAKALCDRRASAYSAAKVCYDGLVARERRIEDLRATIAQLEPELASARVASTDAGTALRRARAERDLAQSQSNRAHTVGERLAAMRAEVREAERRTEAHHERERLRHLRERLVTLDAQIANATRHHASMDVPDARALADLRAAIESERELRSTIAAAALGVTFIAETQRRLRIERADATSDVVVEAQERIELQHDGPLAVVIPGVGRIEIHGPLADLGDARERLTTAISEIAAYARRYGTSDVYALRERQLQIAAVAETVRAFAQDRTELLAGRAPIELAAREEALRAVPACAPGELDALRRVLASADATYMADLETTRAALERADAALAYAYARAEATGKALTALEQRVHEPSLLLTQLTKAETSDADREREVDDAYRACDAAKRDAACALEAYAPYRDLVDPAATFELHRNRACELAVLLNAVTDEAARLDEQFRAAAERGSSSLQTELQERRGMFEEKLRVAKDDEAAIALLKELVDDIERERAASFAEPVLDRVAPWYARLCDRNLAGLRLGAHHGMSGITLPDIDRPIDWSELSGGAADQLAILVRLGFAAMLAADERTGRVPVIFDDPLVNCDEIRRPKMLEILAEAAQDVQVIVFTCHASTFAGSGATMSSIIPRVGSLAS